MSYYPGDFLVVKNVGDESVELPWNSRIVTIKPGEEKPVRVEALISAAGDPRAADSMQSLKLDEDTVQFVPDRPAEVRRLRAKYGQRDGDESQINPEGVPQLEVKDDEGHVLLTVLNDPDGTKASPPPVESAGTQDLMKMIERQQRQINLLKEQAGMDADEAASESDLPEDDTDSPGTPTRAAKSRPRNKKETVTPDFPIKEPFAPGADVPDGG